MNGHWGWALAGIWGALWGRFFRLAIHRLGLYEPVLRPRSRCSRGGAPIVGFHPLVEALSAGLALIVYARFVAAHPGADAVGAPARFLVYFGFVGVLLVIAAVDLEHQMIPDAITYPVIPAAFVGALLLRDVAPPDLLIGIALGYAIVAIPVEVIHWLSGREIMGYGDAKLLMMVGALLGWRAVLFSLFAGAVLASAVSVPLRLLQRQRLFGVLVPFGPFLAAGAALYLLCAQALLQLIAAA